MHILMIFLDGIGLGNDDLSTNPFAVAELPRLHSLSNGKRWLNSTGKQISNRSIFIPTDACFGVSGRPQSGTGQAAIVTGLNISKIIGRHYGPKPDAETRKILEQDNFFKQVIAHGRSAALLEAYPPNWHEKINRGKQLPSSYQYAAREAGVPFYGEDELRAGTAMSGDWTGKGWRTHLGYEDTPIFTPYEAGVRMVELSRHYDFCFFPHWATDVVGHRGTMEEAVELLETFDGVMKGVLNTWNDDEGLVIITSDHGNIEEIGNRRHTENDVPTVVIGKHKDLFYDLTDLMGFVSRMSQAMFTK
jgi:2,3-bisphosphoglycerate-independent phosphoglycerate mutase